MQEFQDSSAISDHQDTPLRRAKLCIDLGRWQEALTLLRPLLADGSDPEAFRLASKAYANLENMTAARRVVEQGLSRWPQEASLHANLALVLHALSLPHAGIKSIRQAIQIDPEWHDYHHIEANILNHLHQFDAAEAAIHRALRLKPNDADYMWTLAAILRNRGKYDEARQIVRRGLAISPNHSDLLMLGGNLEMERTQRIDRYRVSLRANPVNIDTQNLLYRDEKGWRYAVKIALFLCFVQVLQYALSMPHWLSVLLFVMPGLWLAKEGSLTMLWAVSSFYTFFDNARDMGNNLISPSHANFVAELFGHLIPAAVLGGLWALSLTFAWVILLRQPAELLAVLRHAQNHGVLPEKLRDLAASSRTYFNLAVCTVPTFWPLITYFSEYPVGTLHWLILLELAILWLARMLFLPQGGRYMTRLLFLCVILVLPTAYLSVNIHQMKWEWISRLCALLLLGAYSLLVVNYSRTFWDRFERTGST